MDNNGDYSFLQPCVWSESSPQFMSSVQDYGVISGKVDLIEAFFDSSLEFHGAAATRRQLLAEATTDSMSSASAAEISLCQLAAPWINNISPAALEPTQNYQDKYLPGREEEGGAGAVTAVVLSSCDNAPTNSYSRSASSGESENRDSCGSQLKRRARHPQYYTSNYLQHQDELVSQCSSNPPLRRKEQEHNKLRRERYDLDLFGNIPSLCDSTAAAEGGFRIVFGNTSRLTNKKPRHHHRPILSGDSSGCEPDMEAVAQVKEMIYRAAALRPVTFGGAAAEGAAEKPRRRNVRISSDPQTVAARHRRERISERLRVLQRLVPGGGRMDTASMLDEAASYLRFLKSQVAALEALAPPTGNTSTTTTCAAAATSASSSQLTPQYSDSQFLPFRPMQNFPLLRTRASLQALPCCDHVAPAPAGAPLP